MKNTVYSNKMCLTKSSNNLKRILIFIKNKYKQFYYKYKKLTSQCSNTTSIQSPSSKSNKSGVSLGLIKTPSK